MISETLIQNIAQFVTTYVPSYDAKALMKLAFKDAIGCAIYAGDYKDVRKSTMPILEHNGLFPLLHCEGKVNHISGTTCLGSLISWFDFNDVYLDKGYKIHPSETISGVIYGVLIADQLRLSMHKISYDQFIESIAKSYALAIQLLDILKLDQSIFDQSLHIKLAVSATCAYVMGGNITQIKSAISHCLLEVGPLSLYKLPGRMTMRKAWSGADAASRGLIHAVNAVYRNEKQLVFEKDDENNLKFLSYLFDSDDVLGNGDDFIRKLSFKTQFCCAFECHNFLEVMLDIFKSGKKDKIEEIKIFGSHHLEKFFVNQFHPPLEERFHSAQILIASLLEFGKLEVDLLDDVFIESNRYKIWSKMIKFIPDNSLKNDMETRVEFKFSDGTKKIVKRTYPKGHYRNASVLKQMLGEKFKKCLEKGVVPKNIDQIISLFDNGGHEEFYIWYAKLCQLSIRHQQVYDKY